MSQKKILVVEDNDFVRMQIVKFLQDASYEVDEYASAVEAVSALDGGYDLGVLDVRMEPMGGFEFVKNMRNAKIKTPVIFVTGDQDPDLLGEASRLEVSAILIKPVDKERLLKTVEKTIGRYSRGEENV